MSFGSKPKTPPSLPPPPPPPPPEITEDMKLTDKARKRKRPKKTGMAAFKIDLATPTATGLNIPQ